jgi:hypothetical protein
MFPQEAKNSDLYIARKIIETAITIVQVELLSRSGQYIRSRISHPGDTMSKAHDSLAPIEHSSYHGFSAFRCADFQEHIKCWTGCSAMQRPL